MYLQQGQGWQETGQLLRHWRRERRKAKLNWINWGEIYYSVWKGFGREKAQETMGLLAEFPLEVEPVDFDLVRSASEVKAQHALSFADAFCTATALRYNAIVLTGDPEFHSVERLIDIHWI
jgi:ribonuclease VapC